MTREIFIILISALILLASITFTVYKTFKIKYNYEALLIRRRKQARRDRLNKRHNETIEKQLFRRIAEIYGKKEAISLFKDAKSEDFKIIQGAPRSVQTWAKPGTFVENTYMITVKHNKETYNLGLYDTKEKAIEILEASKNLNSLFNK